MSHDHGRHNFKNLKIALLLNLVFAVIELIGGLWTNSIAIITDALHDFGDCISLGMAWYFQDLSRRERTRTFSYGFQRFSPLGAVINAIVLAVGSTIILFEAIPRLWSPEQVDAGGMFWISILGITVNGISFYKLHGSRTLNEKVVSLHLLEDLLGWIAVLAGSVIIYFTDFYLVDPILSVLISAFIIYNAIKNLAKSMRIFLQAVPEEHDLQVTEEIIRSIEGVADVHDLHIWSMDDQYHVLTMHVVVSDDCNRKAISALKEHIKKRLSSEGVDHTTIEIETASEGCADEAIPRPADRHD